MRLFHLGKRRFPLGQAIILVLGLTTLAFFTRTALSPAFSDERGVLDQLTHSDMEVSKAGWAPSQGETSPIQAGLGLRNQVALRGISQNIAKETLAQTKQPRLPQKILVTGGAGLLGSHLVDLLMKQGHRVSVVDNFHTGRHSNVAHWLDDPNFQLILHDVENPLYLEVDQIYHLASPASPLHYMADPIRTMTTNFLGTLNLLTLAKRTGARFLLASTSEVYGDAEVLPQREDYWGHVNPNGPRACYGEGKRAAETLTYDFQRRHGLKVRVARIFNTFGPRMRVDDGRMISNMIVSGLQGKPLTVYGSGNQTRSFQYVSDLVEGMERLMNSNCSLPVNLGNPEEHTVRSLAEMIQGLLGGSNHSRIVHLASPQDDPKRRRPDISRAKECMGWEPKVRVLEGLRKTVDYFREELKSGG